MMDKNREAFETWCMNQCNYDTSKRDRTGSYRSLRTTLAFKVWMASLQAIEVELNGDACHSDDYFNDGYRIATEAAEEAITSLGIRVKGNEE